MDFVFSDSAYEALRRMREQNARGEPLRPGSSRVAAVLVEQGILQRFATMGERTVFRFTPHGWLYACREDLWAQKKERCDAMGLARYWRRSARAAEKAAIADSSPSGGPQARHDDG